MRFPKVDCGAEGLSIDPNSPLVRFTVNGEQVLDITPIEVPIGWNPPETIEMTIARLVRNEVSRAAEAAGFDTLDEAYDFDTPEGDEYEEHLTPHELHAMMHAPEMKPEYPNVRERVEVSKGTAGGAAGGSADAVGGSQDSGGEESSGDRKGDAGADHASSDGGRGVARNRQGTGGRASGSASKA